MAQGKTYQNGQVSIGPIITNASQTQAEFEALAFTRINGIASFPAIRTESAIGSVDTLEGSLNFKGSPTFPQIDLQWVRNVTDAGQILINAAGKTAACYAFKFELEDSPDPATTTNTVFYLGAQVGNVGIVGGGPNDPAQESTNLIRAASELAVNPEPI